MLPGVEKRWWLHTQKRPACLLLDRDLIGLARLDWTGLDLATVLFITLNEGPKGFCRRDAFVKVVT